jgi:hypothetical protein
LPSTQLILLMVIYIFLFSILYCLHEFHTTFPHFTTKFLTNGSHGSFIKCCYNVAYFLCCYLSSPNFLYFPSCILLRAYFNGRTSGQSRERIPITTASSLSHCSSVSVLLASQIYSDLSIPLRPVSPQLLGLHNYFCCLIVFISGASGVES